MPPTMQHLPNELIAHILSYLDSDSSLERGLYRDPSKISRPVHSGKDTPLKNASLVCRTWRRSVTHLLFRHVVWCFHRFYKPTCQDIVAGIDVLDFLRRSGVSKHVESFTIFIDIPRGSGQHRYADGQFWGLLPPESHQPERPMSWNLLWSVLSQEPQRADQGGQERSEEERGRQHWDNNWLWHALFDVIEPLRVTLISSPDLVASLLSRTVDLSSDWAFNSTYYIISLSRESDISDLHKRTNALPSESPVRESHLPTDLFAIRDWTSLFINEGSFAPVYSTYEFFHYSPATLLPVIFEPTDTSFNVMDLTLKSLSYIAIFPLSHHINDFLLANCPPVEHLFVQLMPKNPDFWESDGLSRVILSDLWLECDAAYSILMRRILDPVPQPGWEQLKVFESGDAPSEGVWRTGFYDTYIDGVNGWREESEGVFIRDALPEVPADELESIDGNQDGMEALEI